MAKPIRSPKSIRQDLAQEEIANFLLPVGFDGILDQGGSADWMNRGVTRFSPWQGDARVFLGGSYERIS